MAVSRLRFWDLMQQRLPEDLGFCQSDWGRLARLVNSAQERLITCPEAGDTGWWGSYVEMVFNVSRSSPYITLPREVARLISVDACDHPIFVRNQFYEYLQFGSGRWPKVSCTSSTCTLLSGIQAFRRNVVCTFTDLVPPNKFLRIYSAVADDTLRVLVSCRDAFGQVVNTQDGAMPVNGVFATLHSPFVDVVLPGTVTGLEISEILGIQKDVTTDYVNIYEVDATTGAQRLLVTLAPSEKVAAYQSYYFHSLPQGCCVAPGATNNSLVQVTAIVKLDLIPVVVDSDYLLIQSSEALIAECQSVRYSEMDSAEAMVKSRERHKAAVGYLQGQLIHYEGKENPAISFKPFGSASLRHQRIGRMI